MGQSGSGNGTLNLSSGSITSNGWVAIGRNGGTGLVTMTGGTWTHNSNTNFIVGTSGPGTMTMNAGLVDVVTGYTWVGETTGATTASFTISGTAEFRSRLISVGPEAPNAILNLNGGTVRTQKFIGTRDENGGNQGGTGTISFNGTQIIATAANANFIANNIDNVSVDSGGLLVNSNGFDLGVPKVLSGVGGIVKSGAGKMTLSSVNSYAGDNIISGGELVLRAGSTGTGSISVADGSALGVSKPSGSAQLASTNVTFGTTAAGTTLNLELGDVAGTNPTTAILDVTGNLVLNGDVTVNVAGAKFDDTVMPLVSYVGANRSGAGIFVLDNLPNGVIATIVDDPNYGGPGVGLVYLNITSVALPEWDGTDAPKYVKNGNVLEASADIILDSVTDIVIGQKVFGLGIPTGAVVTAIDVPNSTVTIDQPATVTSASTPVRFTIGTGTNDGVWDTVTQNWVDQVSTLNSVYGDPNPVLFSDLATGPTAVTLNSTVNPSEVTFNNSTLNYSLAGTGAISGTAGLTKQGTGDLTIGITNTYDGVTRLEGGTTTVATIEDGGVASPIGDSSAAPASLVFGGGVLNYTGAADTTNRGFTLTGAGSGLTHANDLTISGQIASTGGNFRKAGVGNLTFTNGGINTFGNGGQVLYASAGTLTFDGTAGGQVNNVIGELWVGDVLDVPANLVVTNTTLNLSSWLAVGPGNGDAGVTNVNVTNSTLQTGGFSTGYISGETNNASESFVTVTGSTWTNLGQIHIAESLNSTGTVNLINTPFTSDSNTTDMSAGAGTTSTLNITGTSEMKVNRFLMALGAGSVANVVIEDSGKLNKTGGSWMSIGNSQNGVGSITIRDSGSLVNAGGDFNIGDVDNSSGTLTLEDNATVTSAGPLFIAKNRIGVDGAGTSGAVNMSGASIMTIGGDTNVGGTAGNTNGSLSISGTSSFSSTGRMQVGPGAGSTGTVLVEGSGNLSVNSYVSVGFNGGGTMTVKDSATYSNTDDFSVNESGDVPATVTVQDSATANVTRTVFVGRNTGRVGTLNVTGDADLNQTDATYNFRVGDIGNGTLNINGATATVSVASNNGVTVANDAAAAGTVNLGNGTPGGTLLTKKVTGGAGSSTFNFNGGVLKANTGADLNFVSGLTALNVNPGGAYIDSNGQTIAIGQVLGNGGGSLTKQGSGTLQLNAANSYIGATTVSAGTIGGTGSVGGELIVPSGSSVAPGASGVGTFTVNDSLAVGSSIGGTFVCEVSGAVADQLAVGDALDVTGATLDFSVLSAPTAPSYVIATFASLSGTFTEQNVPVGYEVVYNPTSITLVQTATPYGTWATSFGLDPLTDGAPGVDKDGDGQSNGVEFALGGSPISGSNNAKVYSLVADSDDVGAVNELLMTIAVRSGTPAFAGSPSPTATMDGATYTIEGSTTLGSFTNGVTPVAPVVTGLPAAPAGYEYRTFSLDGSDGTPNKGFLRVQVNN